METLVSHTPFQQVLSTSLELMRLQPELSIETEWNDDPTPTKTSAFAATVNVGYPFPVQQLDSAAVSDDGSSDGMFTGLFPDTTPRSRYVSLDDGRPDLAFMLPMLGKARSFTNDAKDNAKEVSSGFRGATAWP